MGLYERGILDLETLLTIYKGSTSYCGETIKDYKGFSISVRRFVEEEKNRNDAYLLIDDIVLLRLNPKTSFKCAEFIAKEYIEDVLIPQIESREFLETKSDKEAR